MKTSCAFLLSNYKNQFCVFLFAIYFLIGCDGNEEPILTEEGAAVYLELSELDMEDACAARSLDRASRLAGIVTDGYNSRLVEEDLDMHKIMQGTADELVGHNSLEYSTELQRKLDLLTNRGDYALTRPSWENFSNFVEETEKLLIYNGIPCTFNEHGICTYDDINDMLANYKNLTMLKEVFDFWNHSETLYDGDKLFENMNLVIEASQKNDMSNVREYWENLCEIPGGYDKAFELWLLIKPLYMNLLKFINERLAIYYGVEEDQFATPSYLLGSLKGLDWSINADSLLPHPFIYRRITETLLDKKMGGLKMYLMAQNMTINLNLGKASKTFWSDSLFDKSCPGELVDFCQNGNTVVITCNETSWQNLLDAHETFMSVIQKKIAGDESSQSSYLLRYGSRYSGANEAVPLLSSLLILNSNHLDSLIKIKDERDKLVLLLLHAMRTLPKIPYYLAVDTWRLRLLDPEENSEAITHCNTSEKINLWREIRREYTMIDSYDGELYRDPYVIENKPYLAKFYGAILAFQLYAELIGDTHRDVDIEKHIAQDNKLNELLRSGLSQEWNDLLMNLFYIYDVESDALIKFYSPLEEYITNYSSIEQQKPAPTTTTSTASTKPKIYSEKSESTIIPKPKINRKIEHHKNTQEVKENNSENSDDNLPWIFMAILGIVLLLIVVYVAHIKRKQNKRTKRKNKVVRTNDKQCNTRV